MGETCRSQRWTDKSSVEVQFVVMRGRRMGFVNAAMGPFLYCRSSSHSGVEFGKEFWRVEIFLRYP